MSPDSIKIELPKSLLNELFSAAGLKTPDQVTEEEIKKIIKALQQSKYIDKQTPPPEEIEETEAKSVLVVDDLGLVVYQLSLLLTKNNYNVLLARSAPEAYTIFEERGPFNYILMDLFMPNKEDGISLLSKIKNSIKKTGTQTKIIVMSATKDLEAIEEVISKGADSFLEKGQNWKTDLIETLNKL